MARAEDPVLARRVACDLVAALRRAGHTALLAGGCVRDELLGYSPTDFDVATSAAPTAVRSLFDRTHDVGESFGVILVVERGVTVEVATFRADGDYADKRRPNAVTFSDPQQDAARRDFTVNALFLDPLPHVPQAPLPGAPEMHEHGLPPRGGAERQGAGGRVIDYVGGVRDLQAGVLRAVGNPDARLQEDHLRALRAVRFSARLGFEIEPATFAAIARHARELAGVSRERVGDEVRRMMAHPRRARAAALLHELALDEPVLQEPAHGARSLAVLGSLPAQTPLATCLAAWACDRGHRPTAPLSDPAAQPLRMDRGHAPGADRPEVHEVIRRWRQALCLSNEERTAFRDVLAGVRAVAQLWSHQGVAGRKRLAGTAWFPGAVQILKVVEPGLADGVCKDVEALAATPGGVSPDPWVTGDDLVTMGFSPGRAFKRLLDRLYDEQLEGKVNSAAELRELARRLRV